MQSEVSISPRTRPLVRDLYQHYRALEECILVNEQSVRTTYRSPVNFMESMRMPRHRWFPYKEGFSPSFVKDFIGSTGIAGGLVLDPFSGSGTTPLAASEMGVDGLGMDISPLAVFVSSTKALSLNRRELRDLEGFAREFELTDLPDAHPVPENETIGRYYEPHVLNALLKVKSFVATIDCVKSFSLFKLAFLNAIEPFSTHRKAGNGVKRKTNYTSLSSEEETASVIKSFMLEKIRMFESDIKETSGFRAPRFFERSCLANDFIPQVADVSCVLTSPPYANCFDYSKIYMSELWLGDFFTSKRDQRQFREDSVRSHVHAKWEERFDELGLRAVDEIIRPHIERQQLWSPRIGGMLSGYFSDLGQLLTNLGPRMRRGGRLGFVVGNSFYGGITVATDLLLAELGMECGYEVDEVRICRGVIPSSQQFKKSMDNRKYMRESLVVLRRL